jgi:hypothetical protein
LGCEVAAGSFQRILGWPPGGGRKYTAGNIDRTKYDRLVDLGWATSAAINMSDVEYRATEKSRAAAQMAIDELKAQFPARIELVSADHQLKPDVGSAIIRKWFDTENVDIAIDFVHSAIALAAQDLAKSRNRIVIATAVGTTDFTGKSCNSNSASWLY